MKQIIEFLLVAWVGYACLIYWLVYFHGQWQIVSEHWMGWVLQHVFPHEEAMTIGARCYVYTDTDLAVMTSERRKHEEYHYREQWCKYPLTFLPRYLYEQLRYGYDKSPMENAARAAGGEPTR
jgi:hypothetical protein